MGDGEASCGPAGGGLGWDGRGHGMDTGLDMGVGMGMSMGMEPSWWCRVSVVEMEDQARSDVVWCRAWACRASWQPAGDV